MVVMNQHRSPVLHWNEMRTNRLTIRSKLLRIILLNNWCLWMNLHATDSLFNEGLAGHQLVIEHVDEMCLLGESGMFLILDVEYYPTTPSDFRF